MLPRGYLHYHVNLNVWSLIWNGCFQGSMVLIGIQTGIYCGKNWQVLGASGLSLGVLGGILML
jgi:hypothetical protein